MTHSNRFSERFEIMTMTMDFEVLKTKTKRQFYRNEPPRWTPAVVLATRPFLPPTWGSADLVGMFLNLSKAAQPAFTQAAFE